jgi:hypothetical protein
VSSCTQTNQKPFQGPTDGVKKETNITAIPAYHISTNP